MALCDLGHFFSTLCLYVLTYSYFSSIFQVSHHGVSGKINEMETGLVWLIFFESQV